MINRIVSELIKQELDELDLSNRQLLSEGKYLFDFRIEALEFDFNCPQINASSKYQLDVDCTLIVSSYDSLHVDIEDEEVLVWNEEQELVKVNIDWSFIKKFTDRVNENLELF